MFAAFFSPLYVIRLCDDTPNATRSLLVPSIRSLGDVAPLALVSPRVTSALCNDRSYFAARGQWCTGGPPFPQRQAAALHGVHCELILPRWDVSCAGYYPKRRSADTDRKP